MHKEAEEKLLNWAAIGERGDAVAFVGRRREIDLSIRQLATWRPQASAGQVVVVQGAPGAGKTALLGEIARRLPSVVPNAVSMYLPTPWADKDIPSLLERLAVHMMGIENDQLRTVTRAESVLGVKAAVTARQGRTQLVSPPALTTWAAFEGAFEAQSADARPTMLLVDEVQRLGDGEETKRLLFNLHDQTTFPLVLVCGGLSTSAARLMETGLSRLDVGRVLHIGALEVAEARQSLDESLQIMAADVGCIAGHPDQWARRMAGATQGWPQHITCHFRAAAAALLESRRLAFDDENLGRTLARAEANMRGYRDQRLTISQTHPMVAFAVHEAATRRDTTVDDAADVIDQVAAKLSGSSRTRHQARFPTGIHCLNQMLYAGVVAHANAARDKLCIPIPSMASHIGGLLAAEQREAVRRTLGL